MYKLLAILFLSTVALYAQDCYDPQTGQDCGQCYVVGKTCESAAGHGCPYPNCEWCRKIVRTEFCGTFYLGGACWCFGLNSIAAKESCLSDKFEAESSLIINRQKLVNSKLMKGKSHGFTLGYLSRYRSSKRTS